jgi:DNA-directed RNA polymerase subunit F
MSKPRIISEAPVSMVEVKEEVKRIKKRDAEPSFRVTKVDEYLSSFVTLSSKEEKELIDKIEKLGIPRLKEEHIKKLIDLMPVNLDQLKVILQGYVITVSQDNMKKLAAVFQEYLPEDKDKPAKTESSE